MQRKLFVMQCFDFIHGQELDRHVSLREFLKGSLVLTHDSRLNLRDATRPFTNRRDDEPLAVRF